MAKKNKTETEVEHLRATVRQQKSLIKNLRKEISRSEKRKHLYSDLEEKMSEIDELVEAEKVEPTIKNKDLCPRCSSDLELIEIGVRVLVRCIDCDYRTLKK